MPPDNPRKQDLAPLKEISFMPSTIETIDRALYNYIEDELNISCTTNKGFAKVPLIWAGAERAYQLKHNKDLRDANGWLIYPIMSLERMSISKDVSRRGAFYASYPNPSGIKGGVMTVSRTIKQDKTANFANADSKRVLLDRTGQAVGIGQYNFPGKNDKVVYETITMPIPVYLDVTYKLTIQTEYQQQINEIITPFMTRPGGINYFNVSHDGHSYEVFVESDYNLSTNASSLMEDPRGNQAEINFNVVGYIIGEGKNEERPKLVRRENAVEVKIPREHVVFGDIPENFHVSGNVPFYRE